MYNGSSERYQQQSLRFEFSDEHWINRLEEVVAQIGDETPGTMFAFIEDPQSLCHF